MSGRFRTFVAFLSSWVMFGVLATLAPVAASAAVTDPGGYTSLAPARLLDTRSAVGVPTTTPVVAGGTVALQVLGRGGVPASGVSAVVLNVTVAAPTASGYVTVYGDGTARPTASNLNYVRGQVVPNLVVVPVGANGKVALYNGSAGRTHLIADVAGYYQAGTPTVAGAFGSLVPARLLDTRIPLGVPTTAAVAAGGTVALQVTGRGGVPSAGVSAVVLNVTVTQPAKPGYVTVHGYGTTRPGVSNLNFSKGQTVPNLVIAPVGTGGKVALYNGSAGTLHLIADVAGYYLAGTPSSVGAFGSLAPTRLLDTRIPVGVPTNTPVAAGGTVQLQVAGRAGVPATGVAAVVLNVTVTAPTKAGHVTAYGDGTARPGASNVNFVAGQTVPNLVIAPLGANGKVALYNGSLGTTHLIADVAGYYRSVGLGTISGSVTDAGGTHHGLANVGVRVTSVSAGAYRSATTAADGSYAVAGLLAGTDYKVCFTGSSGATGGSSDTGGYVDQCYDNQRTLGTATPVIVTGGATTAGINAALAAGGAVSGTVTDAGGIHHGLANVQVYVWSDSIGTGKFATTVADGTWSLSGLAAATDYLACFTASGATGGSSDASGYIDQCYDNQPRFDTATPVTVTAGATRTGINAALASGGRISGTVTDTGGTHHGLADVFVTIHSPSTGVDGSASTAVDGTYTVPGLPAGNDYQVCFDASRALGGSSDVSGYVDQCYDNQPTSGTATPVAVTAGGIRTGINAALAGNP